MEWRKAGLVMVAVLLAAGCRLNVGVDGDGSVTSDDGKIDCPGDCKAKLKKGKDLTLTATAGAGSYFVSWKGCDSETEASCTVVGKNKNRKVTAVFAEDVTLVDADISNDVRACAELAGSVDDTPVSTITELVCDNSQGYYGDSFDAGGIDQLASLADLEIKGDEVRGLENMADIAALPVLENLTLRALNLSDVEVLTNLNKNTLKAIDVRENGTDICNDVNLLEEAFPDANINSDCANNSMN